MFDVALPRLVFISSSLLAAFFILQHSLFQSGLESKLTAICDPALAPHHTNYPLANKVLCGMVVFFHSLIDTGYHPLLAVLFSVLGVVALIPFLEAARDHPPRILRLPSLVGTLFQLASMGIVMPIYCLLLVCQQVVFIRPGFPSPSSKINQGNAEALLFGFLLGYVLPTGLMLFFKHPVMTAVWQGFPILIALAAFAHKLIRPPSRHVQSGHTTVIVTLASSFVLSALLYAVYVWPILTDSNALQTMFVPVVGELDLAAMSLTGGVLNFIKWDVIFAAGALMLVTLWMADSLRSFLCILVWHGIATIAVGPATAILGIFLWRETFNGQSQAEKAPEKME